MDEIRFSHHLRHPGMIRFPCKHPQTMLSHGFLGGAQWTSQPSTVPGLALLAFSPDPRLGLDVMQLHQGEGLPLEPLEEGKGEVDLDAVLVVVDLSQASPTVFSGFLDSLGWIGKNKSKSVVCHQNGHTKKYQVQELSKWVDRPCLLPR